MTALTFMVARNPDPDSRLPYLIRLPLADGPLVLKAGAPWPRTAKVYCHRADGWPEVADRRGPQAAAFRDRHIRPHLPGRMGCPADSDIKHFPVWVCHLTDTEEHIGWGRDLDLARHRDLLRSLARDQGQACLREHGCDLSVPWPPPQPDLVISSHRCRRRPEPDPHESAVRPWPSVEMQAAWLCEELLHDHLCKLARRSRAEVHVSDCRTEPRDFCVVEAGRQYVGVVLADGPRLSTSPLMGRPHLARVICRGEKHAVSCGLLVDPIKMFVQVFAPQVDFLVVVVEPRVSGSCGGVEVGEQGVWE